MVTSSAAADFATEDEQLSVRILHSFAEAEPLRSVWNNLVRRSGADIYQTFEWCQIWWQHYGARRQLHLLLCFAGDDLVGLVPAFIETLWLGPVCVRAAKLIGSDFTIHLCNLPVVSAAFPSVISTAIDYFFAKQRCDLLLFGPLSGPTARIDELMAAGRNEPALVERAEALGDSCNTYFDLPNSFEEYLKSISKNQRSNLKRGFAQLSKAHRVTFDVVSSDTEVEAEFEAFCQLHDTQWRAVGKLGHFGDWPHARDFNRDLVRTFGKQGLVRFYRILADDQVVTSHYSFVFGDTNYWRLPARVSGFEWDKLSLGALGMANKIEWSISAGLRTVEGGRGHYPYKLHLGGREWPLRTVQFVRRGPGVSARARCFSALAFLVDLVYYKVLFMRLAPRIRLLRRPLWPIWIRSRW